MGSCGSWRAVCSLRGLLSSSHSSEASRRSERQEIDVPPSPTVYFSTSRCPLQVVYFTSTFPYVMMLIMVIRGCTLPGAEVGIEFYLKPDFSRLLDSVVWADAAVQIFYSLSCCTGGLIAMASYNEFKNNAYRDSILVPLINCATSLFAGFAIFSVLGYMAELKGVSVDEVAASGKEIINKLHPFLQIHPIKWLICFRSWTDFRRVSRGTGEHASCAAVVHALLLHDAHARLQLAVLDRRVRVRSAHGPVPTTTALHAQPTNHLPRRHHSYLLPHLSTNGLRGKNNNSLLVFL